MRAAFEVQMHEIRHLSQDSPADGQERVCGQRSGGTVRAQYMP